MGKDKRSYAEQINSLPPAELIMSDIQPDIHSAMLEIERLQARIAELIDYGNQLIHPSVRRKIKAEGIREFKASFNGIIQDNVTAKDFDDYADKLEKSDD